MHVLRGFLGPRIVYDPDRSGEAYKPRRGKNSTAKVNMRESEEAYIKLGSDVVMLVGEGDKGSAGGGMRPRIGEGVVRRQPRVLVEWQILPLRTFQSQISPETKPSHPKPQITDRKRVVTNADLGSRFVRPDSHANSKVAIAAVAA